MRVFIWHYREFTVTPKDVKFCLVFRLSLWVLKKYIGDTVFQLVFGYLSRFRLWTGLCDNISTVDALGLQNTSKPQMLGYAIVNPIYKSGFDFLP